jgi:hypothetical protein
VKLSIQLFAIFFIITIVLNLQERDHTLTIHFSRPFQLFKNCSKDLGHCGTPTPKVGINLECWDLIFLHLWECSSMKVFQLAPFPYFSIGNKLKVRTTTHDAYVKVKLKFEL